jgi:carbon-monoxide dehydrogenase medium subunit
MPACAVAMDAVIVLQSVAGRREVPAREFFFGLYETDRRDEEMMIEARFPVARDGDVFGFDEVARRHGDFPIVGVAARASSKATEIGDLDLVVFACGPQPHLIEKCRDIAKGQRWSRELIAELADVAAREIEPMENLQGSPETKRRQTRTIVGRVLTDMMRDASIDV